ncbi:hypothetical protein STEG23_014050, partial [Scotinomys teguina]
IVNHAYIQGFTTGTTILVNPSLIPVDPSVIPVDTSVIPVDPSVITVDIPVITVDTSIIPVDTSVIPVDTSVIPVDTYLIPVDTSVNPVDTSVIPVDTSVIPVDTSVILWTHLSFLWIHLSFLWTHISFLWTHLSFLWTHLSFLWTHLYSCGHICHSCGYICHSCGHIFHSGGHICIPADTSVIPVDISVIPVNTSVIPVETSVITVDISVITLLIENVSTSSIWFYTGNLDLSSLIFLETQSVSDSLPGTEETLMEDSEDFEKTSKLTELSFENVTSKCHIHIERNGLTGWSQTCKILATASPALKLKLCTTMPDKVEYFHLSREACLNRSQQKKSHELEKSFNYHEYLSTLRHIVNMAVNTRPQLRISDNYLFILPLLLVPSFNFPTAIYGIPTIQTRY